MKARTIPYFVALAACVYLTAGCGTTVKRVQVENPIDLSGRWNDTDSRQVAKAMIADCLARSWQPMFQGENKRVPVVIVGDVKNQSHEHINSEVFTKELERNLINSGKVKFVASKGERPQVREERQDQQENSSAVTRKKLKNETGADYMLIGSINSIKDEVKSRYVIMYQVNLELIDLETNEKVWLGEENIKKIVEKSKYSL